MKNTLVPKELSWTKLGRTQAADVKDKRFGVVYYACSLDGDLFASFGKHIFSKKNMLAFYDDEVPIKHTHHAIKSLAAAKKIVEKELLGIKQRHFKKYYK